MHQPHGMPNKQLSNHVYLLHKAIYGLKQAPRAWNLRFAKFVTNLGFVSSKSALSLFFMHGNQQSYLLLYVDDIIFTTSDDVLLQSIITNLKTKFPLADTGKPDFFLGVKADFNDGGIFLSQTVYIIHRAGMVDSKRCSTPVDIQSKMSAELGEPVSDPTAYLVWLECCSTSPLPVQTFRTQLIKCVCLYMI